MKGTASDYFAAMIEEYDSLILRCVPLYEVMLARTVEYGPDSALRILELGCGTGNLSLALAARHPGASLCLMDASAEMLELTRGRLEQAGHPADAIRTLCGRFEELEERGQFDLITSAISVHHVIDKPDLFRRLHAALIPGGALVLLDQMRGATDKEHALNVTRWKEFCRRPGNCTEEELESLVQHAEAHDHYVPVLDHVRQLEAAGFHTLDVVWRNWMWGVIVATA